MAKFKFAPTISVDGYFSTKLKGDVGNNDYGKAVKLSTDTTDTYELCADGDGIDGFIVSIEAATADGLKFGTVNSCDRKRVQASGAMNIGNFVESAAQAAAGTAEANDLPLVSVHTAVVGDVIRWRVISANTTDGVVASGDTTVVVERA